MTLVEILKSMFKQAPRLTPQDGASRLRAREAILVDVREPGEWTDGVADSAVLLPLSDLTGPRVRWRPFLTDTPGREILLYCASGGRSGMAARILVAEGFRAANVGGFTEWVNSGWPVVRPATKRTR